MVQDKQARAMLRKVRIDTMKFIKETEKKIKAAEKRSIKRRKRRQ